MKLCLWSEIQTSPTGYRGPYQCWQTLTCQLRLFSRLSSDHSHHAVQCVPYSVSDRSLSSDTSIGADRNMRDAYATFSCPVQTLAGTPGLAVATLWGLAGGGRVTGGWGVRALGQDLDYNTVIIYFTADDLIGFSPCTPRGVRTLCVCVY